MRKIGKYSRYLPRQVFTRELHNGERKSRDWVLYSCSGNSLYCFYCLLFAQNEIAFSHQGKGFINWKKCLDYVKNHEKNQIHLRSMKLWFSKQSENLESRNYRQNSLKLKFRKKNHIGNK